MEEEAEEDEEESEDDDSEEDEEGLEESFIDTLENYKEKWKEIDLFILESYNDMPGEFKKEIPFKDYYSHHVSRITVTDLFKPNGENEFNGEEQEDISEIPKEELCERCNKERKISYPYHADYCFKCIAEFKKEAEPIEERITEETLKDDVYLKEVTSENKSRAYVKDKYKEEKKKNPFVRLDMLGKDIYYKKTKGKSK